MIYFVIPARAGSKGFPGKNRKLLKFTLATLNNYYPTTVITSDDPNIWEMAPKESIVLKRKPELSNDTASTKDVLLNVIDELNMDKDDILVLLYLTYPQRTINDILNAIKIFLFENKKSLLCKKEVKTHPYLCINADGSQVVKHDLYRRQDYPEIFEISHFIGIFKVSEVKKLNKNLYNENTFFYYIQDVIDVDYKKDLLKL